jgi:hypothetical protein
MVKPVRRELAIFTLSASKNFCRDVFGICAANSDDGDAAFARRRRDRGYRVFFVHKNAASS